MNWRDYVAGLTPAERDTMLYALLDFQLDAGADADIRFTEGEDPEYQGAYTVNAQIYWTNTGDNLLGEKYANR